MGRRSWILIGVLGLVTGVSQAQLLPPSGFEEGQPFPHVVLPSTEDGRPMSLADFRGKKVILHVFASW